MAIEFKLAITFAVILLLSILGALGRPSDERNMDNQWFRAWTWGVAIGFYGAVVSLLVAVWRLA